MTGVQTCALPISETVDETKLVLKSVNLEGHDERTHLRGGEVTEFRVSPDGGWVAFTERYNAFVAPFAATVPTRTCRS